MPRGKKSGRGTPRGGRGGRGNIRGRGNHANPSPAPWQQAGFTLMEAARETSRHDHKVWGLNSLRTKPIIFVSAGPIEPLKQLEDIVGHKGEKAHEDDAAGSQSPPPEEKDEASHTDIDHVVASMAEAGEQRKPSGEGADPAEKEAAPNPAPFFFDVTKSRIPPMTVERSHTDERPLSRQSNSSDEVILFKGRDSRPRVPENEQISMSHMRQELTVVESQMAMEAHNTIVVSDSRKKAKGRQRRDQRPPKRKDSHDDAMIADYIENMRENGEEDMLLQMIRNQQDIGGSDYIPSSDEAEPGADDDEASAQKPGPDGGLTNVDDADVSKSRYQSESELDDETLAQLLAGHELGQNPNPFHNMVSSESDSSEEPPRWVDDLDIMDWERPSLRPKKKGKVAKGRINIEVSDSELEQTLQAAWKNDRFRKAERKRQREEMRALGQLGRNAKPEDLRVKYPGGMTVEEVAEEMRVFLQGTNETLALPPMDKHARKMIHDLASKFNIKSKSIGNGDNRRPTLNRTKRTQQYSAASFDAAVKKVNRRYFPRLDGGRGGNRPRTIASGGGANMAAVTVQDGEIVGAAAPELGIENRGRAMLEKMGWSKGTALGASDNKGILQPVSHAMKRSKAGLG
ncbi:r3H domain-containing protein [Sarocladium implicatum]|nr:r3H domain-containing protein [Sarocladium implicatum]